MTTNLFADVKLFATQGNSPTFNSDLEATLQLCYDLVEEEVAKEFLPALMKYANSRSLENLTEAVDGAIDGIYVLIFFLSQMGIDGQKMWDIVQKANMAKFVEGKFITNPLTGKVMKPPGWVAPDQAIHVELIEWNSAQCGVEYKNGMVGKLSTTSETGEE